MLDLYGTFDDMTKWTIKRTNEFKIKVYAHIGILVKLDIFYDDKQALYTQYKRPEVWSHSGLLKT